MWLFIKQVGFINFWHDSVMANLWAHKFEHAVTPLHICLDKGFSFGATLDLPCFLWLPPWASRQTTSGKRFMHKRGSFPLLLIKTDIESKGAIPGMLVTDRNAGRGVFWKYSSSGHIHFICCWNVDWLGHLSPSHVCPSPANQNLSSSWNGYVHLVDTCRIHPLCSVLSFCPSPCNLLSKLLVHMLVTLINVQIAQRLNRYVQVRHYKPKQLGWWLPPYRLNQWLHCSFPW